MSEMIGSIEDVFLSLNNRLKCYFLQLFIYILNHIFEIEMFLNCSTLLNIQNFQTFASLFFKVGFLFRLLFCKDI